MSNGTPESRRAREILCTNTKIGNSMLSTARSGFDADRFNAMQVCDRRYLVVDAEPGSVSQRKTLGSMRSGFRDNEI
jgi:hypothetical protein